MRISTVLLVLGGLFFAVAVLLRPYSRIARRNSVFSMHFRIKARTHVVVVLAILSLPFAASITPRHYSGGRLWIRGVVAISLLLIYLFLRLRFSLQYSKAWHTFWLFEITYPKRMLLGNSYQIDFRLVPVTIEFANGYTNPLTGRIHIGPDAVALRQSSFLEQPLNTMGEMSPAGSDLKVAVSAPGFEIAPKEFTVILLRDSATTVQSFIAMPKTSGDHKIMIETATGDTKLGQATLDLQISSFWLVGRLGLTDSQLKMLQLVGLACAMAGSVVAILKAFGLI